MKNFPKIKFLASALIGLGLCSSVSADTKIADLHVTGFTNYTAGVSTQNIFINISNSTGGVVEPDQLIELDVTDGGEVIPNAISPSSFMTSQGVFSYGGPTMPITVFRAGSSIVITARSTQTATERGLTTNVNPGPAAKLIVLAPGQSLFEGTNPSLTNGVVGTATIQQAGQPFALTIKMTDDQFNEVSSADTVSFSTGTFLEVPADSDLVGGVLVDDVTLTAGNITRTITVTDKDNTSIDAGSAQVTTGGPAAEEVIPHPSPFNPHEGSIKFQFHLENGGDGKVIVINQFGQKVWERSTSVSARTVTDVSWDGKNEEGVMVAAGAYYVMLEVDGKIKSKKKFGVVK